MPRQARNLKKYKMYHIMVQGINREFIFNDDMEKEKYIEIMREKLGDYHSIIIAYCVMINHAHFLAYSENDREISRLFQRVNCTYSNYYNKSKNRVGYVFRDRFLSKEIFNEAQKIKCIRYIHNNPIKAKIVKNEEEYLYSSYREFKNRKSGLIDFSIVGRMINIDEIFVDDKDEEKDKDIFLDVKEYDKNDFEDNYLHSIDLNELKQDKERLKQEIKKCRIKMKVPVAEISRIFKVPDKTIYRWLKE